MNENYEALVALFKTIEEDYAKVVAKSNKAAGRRVRVNSAKMMKLLKEFRKSIVVELYVKKD